MNSDRAVLELDRVLRTLFGAPRSRRPIPGTNRPEVEMSETERAHACGLMRVNHVGEVCAQALYQGQAITSRNVEVSCALLEAAEEEVEHLAWTAQRIAELGGRTSLLNPLWYGGALALGVAAGLLGDRWNLGFLAETERQVEAHLDGHLENLPAADLKSRDIVAQMRQDEAQHAELAIRMGAAELPQPARLAMRLAAKLMTSTAYRL
ncbi:MAG: 2-polyprenyl-3-methyl-6-methoxy-1,4-benzoquinone monooxygenase [Betaproteobacteria bacterium]|nr:2-polyprenyl-3-methyl-6-methoxy-1,4-benzoquinone monooxygenase [Betaproteobacteria bacterium]